MHANNCGDLAGGGQERQVAVGGVDAQRAPPQSDDARAIAFGAREHAFECHERSAPGRVRHQLCVALRGLEPVARLGQRRAAALGQHARQVPGRHAARNDVFHLQRQANAAAQAPLGPFEVAVEMMGHPEHGIDKGFEARVAHIAPLVDAQRGSVEVKLALPAPPEFLRDDLTVSVEVLTGRRERTLVVPSEALRPGPSVLLLVDGVTVLRPVSIGLRSLVAVEVLKGLAEGEQLVLDAAAVPGQRARPGSATGRGKSAGGGGAEAEVNAMGR